MILQTSGRFRCSVRAAYEYNLQPVRYREFKPQFPLNRYVECYWTLERDAATQQTQPDRILPDGCVELILNFGDSFSQHEADRQQIQPKHFLAGQMTRPILISPNGVVDLIGIRFHPGGTVPFVRTPMHEFTDQVVELGGISALLERQLFEASIDLKTFEERVSAINTVLAAHVLKSKFDSWALDLATKIVEQRGLVSIEQLANDAGVSTRQLERRFLTEVGLAPKLLSRIMRFQQIFRAIESCEGAWAPVAVECGYYDQAHLIRDFHQFAHQTPAILFSQQSSLTESFTRKNRASDFYNT
jgi:AraC-like DNA-binding protein